MFSEAILLRALLLMLVLIMGCRQPTIEGMPGARILVCRTLSNGERLYILKSRLRLHLNETWSLIDQDGDAVPAISVPAPNAELIRVDRNGVVEIRRRNNEGCMRIGALAVYQSPQAAAALTFKSETELNASVRAMKAEMDDLFVIRPVVFAVRAIDREPRFRIESVSYP